MRRDAAGRGAATGQRPRQREKERRRLLTREGPGSRSEPLFGNVLPETVTAQSIVALARSSLSIPQSVSASPPLAAPAPLSASPNASLFTCHSVAAYLSSHSSSSPQRLVPLPPFHPPRHTSPLSPSVAPSALPPPLSAQQPSSSQQSSAPSLAPFHFPLWQNQLPAVLSSALSHCLPLSPHLVALSASAGMDVYQQLCRVYAGQLEREGEPHTGVLYLLAVGDVLEAVQLYVRAAMWGEAMLLARCRLARDDKLIAQLWSGWGLWSWQQRQWLADEQQQQRQHDEADDETREADDNSLHRLALQAVGCYVAAGEMEKALQCLIRASVIYPRHSSSSASPPLLSVCPVDRYLPLAYELAVLSYPTVLVSVEVFRWVGEYAAMQEQWDVALDAYGRDPHWATMQCLVLVERLAAHSLHLSAQHSSGASKDELPLPTLVQQAWAASSLALQPTLPAAYKLLTSFTSFPFVSSPAAASLLYRTRANFAFHLSLSCLAATLSPSHSLPALSDAAFELYRPSFLSSLLLLVDGSLAPRMKELRRSDERGLYALTVFGVLLRAVQSGQRWQRRELVMWGLLDYKDAQQTHSSHSHSHSPHSALPATDDDGQLQCRALESATQLLLLSPAAMLASQLHRRHCITRRLLELDGSAALLAASLSECDDSIGLLSHQLSVRRPLRTDSEWQWDEYRSHFPLPVESSLLLLLYARRFCSASAAVHTSALSQHWRRCLATAAAYIQQQPHEHTAAAADAAAAAAEGGGGDDVAGMLRLCYRLCAAGAASAAAAPQTGQCWEPLPQFVAVEQFI